MGKLRKLEKRILAVHQEMSKKEDELSSRLSHHGVTDAQLQKLTKSENKLLQAEFEELTMERQFLLDRREYWLPKTIWILLVPIVVSLIVSIITPYILSYFLETESNSYNLTYYGRNNDTASE